MDLGATVCTPDSPKCPLCPWQKECQAYKENLTDKIPLIQKPGKKDSQGHLWLIRNTQGAYYIQKRCQKGLLSGLYEFPWCYFEDKPLLPISSKPLAKVTHTFTHFKLTLNIYLIHQETGLDTNGFFKLPSDFKNYPFSTLMKKVIQKIK